MREPIKLTVDGHERLLAKRDELSLLRKASLERVKAARKFCDFREDVTYMELVREHERLEQTYLQIEDALSDAELIDEVDSDVIGIGSVVEIRELPDEPTETYRLVEAAEADMVNGSISIVSPLGAQLKGKQAGDRVVIRVQGEEIEFEIVEIKG